MDQVSSVSANDNGGVGVANDVDARVTAEGLVVARLSYQRMVVRQMRAEQPRLLASA